MKAAVVTSFDRPPRYEDFPDPQPSGDEDVVVDVLAAAIHPRVRSQADGSHYTSTDELPLIPGIDGVGRGPDGLLRYFILPDTHLGSMAQRTLIDTRRSVILPAGVDPVQVAAGMNPAMSAWIALRRRIDFQPGANVLILGATGSAGQMAVQVAKVLGAQTIVAAGRDAARLAAVADSGATALVQLTGDEDATGRQLAAAASDVDVVIDYLWGSATAAALVPLVMQRADRRRKLTWIEVGSVVGSEASIPSAALRAARLDIVGSGQGSVSTEEIVAELPSLVKAIASRSLTVDAQEFPLEDVERVWRTQLAARVVLRP